MLSYAVLVTNGDNDSFPLWYAQEVEGVRRDVTVALTPYLGLEFYVRQLARRPVPAYDAARGPAEFRARAWARPTAPPLALSDAGIAALPEYVELREPRTFEHGAIRATIPPGVLGRDQLVVLRLVKDAFPARPIYFTAGGYAQAIGLAPYLLGQGLVQRLMPAPVATDAMHPPIAGGTHLDVARTAELWERAYRGQHAVVREGGWVDRASVGIPLAYAITGEQLGAALARAGDSARAARVVETARAVARAARLGPTE